VEHKGAVLHASGVATVASATRAPVPLIGIVPTASGVGSGALPPVPCASWTRYRAPGAIDPDSGVTCHAPVPEAELYCTDQPSRSTAAPPRLNSSTKSFVSVAPVFPPPP
jgi:hypothetical protein